MPAVDSLFRVLFFFSPGRVLWVSLLPQKPTFSNFQLVLEIKLARHRFVSRKTINEVPSSLNKVHFTLFFSLAFLNSHITDSKA